MIFEIHVHVFVLYYLYQLLVYVFLKYEVCVDYKCKKFCYRLILDRFFLSFGGQNKMGLILKHKLDKTSSFIKATFKSEFFLRVREKTRSENCPVYRYLFLLLLLFLFLFLFLLLFLCRSHFHQIKIF